MIRKKADRARRECDVLVIGAGPVGLFTALSLAERDLDVQIIDTEWRGSMHSYALALHPGSLRLLDEYAAADELLEGGHRVEHLGFYDHDDRVGEIRYSELPGAFPFTLSVAQSSIERALEARLAEAGVSVLWNHRALHVEEQPDNLCVTVGRIERYSTGYPVARTERFVASEHTVHTAFLVGADGYHSTVRDTLDTEFKKYPGTQAFEVFEFQRATGFHHEARVVLRDDSVNAVWPLSAQRVRWNFQVDAEDSPPLDVETASKLIRERAPWFGTQIDRIQWTATAIFEHRLAESFGRNRIWLAGDSAHIAGPIGAQSMNVGLREGHDLAQRISSIQKGAASLDLLEAYGAERRAEWRGLLGLEHPLEASKQAAPWARLLAPRLLPCIAASSEDLRRLLGQVGLVYTPADSVSIP